MKRMTRRDFVTTVETIGIACVVPGLLTRCASVRYAKSSVESDRLVVLRTDLSASGTVLVETPDEQLPILLRRVSDTEFVALSTKCTHRGCQVENAGTQLSCPCHGSVFSLTGERLQGPADRPLTRFAVSADDRNIFISRRAVAE